MHEGQFQIHLPGMPVQGNRKVESQLIPDEKSRDRSPGYLAASQIPQELPPRDEKQWVKALFEPETDIELVLRWGRELGRKHGNGPTSLIAALNWANIRIFNRMMKHARP